MKIYKISQIEEWQQEVEDYSDYVCPFCKDTDFDLMWAGMNGLIAANDARAAEGKSKEQIGNRVMEKVTGMLWNDILCLIN